MRISDAGRHVLAQEPSRIDIKFLVSLDPSKSGSSPEGQEPPGSEPPRDTPEERIGAAYRELRQALAEELLDTIKTHPPMFFERLVVDLMVAMGYGGSREEAGQVIGGPGDEGIDGTINEDTLGLDSIYLQAKRWSGVVGRPEIQQFAGALHGKKARKGVFITTSSFTGDAKTFAEGLETRIILIDGTRLAQLMIDHGIGVTTVQTIPVHRLNWGYFPEQ